MHAQIKWIAIGALVLLGLVFLLPRLLSESAPEPETVSGVVQEEPTLESPEGLGIAAVPVSDARAPAALAEDRAEEEGGVTPAARPVTMDELVIEVLDAAGRPLRGAEVEYTPDWASGFADAGFYRFHGDGWRSAESTDRPGRFRAKVLVERAYRVAASAKGHASVERSDCHAGQVIQLMLEPGARFEGIVRSAEDRVPVPDAQVRVFHGLDGDHIDQWTDESGRFAFEGLVPGDGAFLVSPQSYQSTRYAEVLFAPGDTLVRDVEVEAGWRIKGQVRAAATEAPVAGADVSAWAFQGKTVTADANGFFVLEGLKPLPGRFLARAPGYAKAQVEYRGPGESVDVKLTRAVSVRGQLLDPSGAPLANGHVGYIPGNDHFMQPATSNAEGVFVLEGLHRTAKVRLLPRVAGYAAAHYLVDLGQEHLGVDGAIDLGPLTLVPGAIVAGKVRWSTGAPAHEARLYLGREDDPSFAADPWGKRRMTTESRNTYCAEDGSFRLVAMDPGTWKARVLAPGVTGHVETFTVSAGQRLEDLEWILPDAEGAVISGRVLGPDGAPLRQVIVNVVDESQERPASHYVRTDERGAFRFEHLVADSYTLNVHADDDTRRALGLEHPLVSYTQSGLIADGRHLEIQLRAADLEIRGQVVDASGKAVPQAYVCREEANDRYPLGVLADDSGRFRIQVDPAADTRIVAWRTKPFGETEGSMSVAEFHLQRSILDYPDGPVAATLRRATGAAEAVTAVGGGTIVLD